MKRIVLLDDYQGVALDYGGWDRVPDEWQIVALEQHLADPDELVEALGRGRDRRSRCGSARRCPAAILDRLPELKLLITTGMANVAIDVAAAQRNGVVVCGTGMQGPADRRAHLGPDPGAAAQDPRRGRGDARAAAGRTRSAATSPAPPSACSASAASASGWPPSPRPSAWRCSPGARTSTRTRRAPPGVEPVAKEALFERADIVSVHYKLSERSRGLVGAAELAAMKPSAYLVNTSRGPIVDTDALVAALYAGEIAGAGIDVYDAEPLAADHPLRKAPHTVLTPHLGYVTEDTYEVFFEDAVEDVLAYLDGAPVRVIEP